MSEQILTIRVSGKPVGQGAMRRSASGGMHHAEGQRLKTWRNRVADAARIELERLAIPLDDELGEYLLVMEFRMARPKSQTYRNPRGGAPDVDKLGRGVADALEGVLYANDNQVMAQLPWQRYSEPKHQGATIHVHHWWPHATRVYDQIEILADPQFPDLEDYAIECYDDRCSRPGLYCETCNNWRCKKHKLPECQHEPVKTMQRRDRQPMRWPRRRKRAR